MKTLILLSVMLSSQYAFAHENMGYLATLRDRIQDKKQEVREDRQDLKGLVKSLKKETDPGDIKVISKKIVKVSKELTKDRLKLDQLQDKLKQARRHCHFKRR